MKIKKSIIEKITRLVWKYNRIFSDEELHELDEQGFFKGKIAPQNGVHDASDFLIRRRNRNKDSENTTFTIKCTMKNRWVPYFISFLKRMEANGNIGHSELIGFFSDGDGDFRPEFIFDSTEVNDDISNKVDSIKSREESIDYYDAG